MTFLVAVIGVALCGQISGEIVRSTNGANNLGLFGGLESYEELDEYGGLSDLAGLDEYEIGINDYETGIKSIEAEIDKRLFKSRSSHSVTVGGNAITIGEDVGDGNDDYYKRKKWETIKEILEIFGKNKEYGKGLGTDGTHRW